MEILIFGGKILILLVFFVALVLVVATIVARAQQRHELEVEPLNDRLRDVEQFLKSFRQSKEERKEDAKRRKKEEKKKEKKGEAQKQVFVLKFKGDVHATQGESLREEVNAILMSFEPGDEVLCSVESPGGVVHGYGFAASQLVRLREAGLRVVVAVDQVAASGGYLMACVAHEVIAAPFAIVGSIGVVAQLPNFHRVLKKYDVDYKEYTAGEFKRTVSLLGEITAKGEEKFIEQLEDTHLLFKHFVSKYRTHLDISKVATGEYWYGEQALGLGLIDKIKTSDDFVLEKLKEDALILSVKFEKSKSLQEKLAEIIGASAEGAWVKIWTRLEKQKYF